MDDLLVLAVKIMACVFIVVVLVMSTVILYKSKKLACLKSLKDESEESQLEEPKVKDEEQSPIVVGVDIF